MANVEFTREDLNIYATICSALDNDDWNYEKDEENLVITTQAKGDDLPISILLRVNAKTKVISFHSLLPCKFEDDKLVDGALACAIANYGLIDGSFDFDMKDGSVMFRLTSSYRDSIISESLIKYLIYCGAGTVDRYNDRLFMLAKGMIDLKKFAELEASED